MSSGKRYVICLSGGGTGNCIFTLRVCQTPMYTLPVVPSPRMMPQIFATQKACEFSRAHFQLEIPVNMSPLAFMSIPLSAWIGLGVSFAACGLIVLTKSWHGPFTYDTEVGPQKFHEKATPRIGGTALFLDFWAGTLVAPSSTRPLLIDLGLCGALAFFAGSAEDLWKKTRPVLRLGATAGAALSFCLLTGYRVTRLEIPIIDELLVFPFISIAFTVFAIAGLMNAVNIIDGFHGLASGSVVLMTAAFGAVAAAVGDTQLLLIAVSWPCCWVF